MPLIHADTLLGKHINSLMFALFWRWLPGLFTPSGQTVTSVATERGLEITRASAHQ